MRTGVFFFVMMIGAFGCRQDSLPTEVAEPLPDYRGKSLAIEAEVEGGGTLVECFLSLDSWDAFCYADLVVTLPADLAGQKLKVGYFERSLPQDSILRRSGTRCRFTLSGDKFNQLKAEELRRAQADQGIWDTLGWDGLTESDLEGLTEIADESNPLK